MAFLFRILMVLTLIAPLPVAAQPVLDLARAHHFAAPLVDASAIRGYQARIAALAAQGRLDTDAALLARLRGLLGRLAAAARFEQPDSAAIEWEIHTCGRCPENASAMAGGKLLVGEAFVAGLGASDAELAFLLGHEMGHVLAEHTREFASVARYFLDNGRERDYEDIQQELDTSLPVALRMADIAVQQEHEADFIGLVLGARAGHPPEAMLAMLGKLGGGSRSGFSLHPAAAERLERMAGLLETARRIRASGMR